MRKTALIRGNRQRRALIVAGPTASGKSVLAVTLAEQLGGTVINADSMQVYRELRVLTARPAPAEEARAPHALYAVRAAAEPGSAGWWRDSALAAMDAADNGGRVPILCGGTGLYLSALVDGLANIPVPDAASRAEARALLAEIGPAGLYGRLVQADPTTAATLRPSDGQRVARAWEIWRSTGQPLASWQRSAPQKSDWQFAAILLDPPRAVLRDAIAGRFRAMMAAGALVEVEALLSLKLDPGSPLLRAQGVQPLAAHLRGEMTPDEASASAILSTCQYMKRQVTWFRHHRLADPASTHHMPALPADAPSEIDAAIGFASAFLSKRGSY